MMEPSSNSNPLSEAAAFIRHALAWWAEAGVDYEFHEQPTRWLADNAGGAGEQAPAIEASPRSPVAAAIAEQDDRLVDHREEWPTTLDAFCHWWLTEPRLQIAGDRQSVPPRGSSQAEIAFLVPMPEAGDSDRLLAGSDGAFLRAMLKSMAIDERSTYLASVVPQYDVAPDWRILAGKGWADILNHHLELLSPRRIVAFGLDPLLLGVDASNSGRTPFSKTLGDGRRSDVLPAPALSILSRSASRKAGFWNRWLDWTQEDKTV